MPVNQKSIDRARWLMSQYVEVSPEHLLAQTETTLGDLIADLRYYTETLGLKWADVESVSWVSLDGIKQGE